ncbi:MAG: DUF1836 domain-containing protein [Oscillospiraceae bacterium]|nr:DUF1836 domain-containing protein [Oscillospiraceae bacterium]
MAFDNSLVAGKLRRWESYLENFRLPAWEEIPDFGLYMEQVTALLQKYLDYLPSELKEEQFITASTINNYVRTRVMPEPVKRRYYRTHIAYLIIILTLKQSLSIALIQKIVPIGLTEREVEQVYTVYAAWHRKTARYFIDQTRLMAGPILGHEPDDFELAAPNPEALVITSGVLAGFSRLFTEKLLLLDGQDLTDGGSIGRPPKKIKRT